MAEKEGGGARRRYREPRRRFQLKCRHRRIAAVGVGVGVGVARVMCTTWPAHANRTPPRLSAFPSSSRRVLFYRPAPSSHLPIPYPCPQSLFSLFLFFFSILLPPSNIAHVGAEGELRSLVSFHRRCSWAPGRVPGRDSKFFCLFALPFCICSFYFISFFFSFYFFGLCSSDLTKKRERKGSFEVSFFSFFFLDSREDGSLSLSRLGEKEDFWIRGNSWESGIWLNLMGEFGSFGDFSFRGSI